MKESLKKILKKIIVCAIIVIAFWAVIKLPTYKKTGLDIDTRIVELTFDKNSVIVKDAINFELTTPLLFRYSFGNFPTNQIINSSNIEISHNGLKDYYYTTYPNVILTNNMLHTLGVNGPATLSMNVT